MQKQCGEVYRLEKEAFYGWILYEYYKEQCLSILSFTEQQHIAADLIPSCTCCELHADSPFKIHRMLAIKTIDGRKSIDGNTFRIIKGQ